MAAETTVLDFRTVDFSSGLTLVKSQTLLNQTFYIRTERDGVVVARLVSVEQLKRKKPALVPLQQFSLFFRGPPLPALPSGLYEVEHWLAGRTVLNLTAIQPTLYRADFCLLP